MTKRLLAKAIKKVHFTDEGSFNYNKEFLVRRNHDDYASIVSDKVKFTVYKIATNEKADNDYGILGKCLVNKSLNFLVTELKAEDLHGYLREHATADELTHLREGTKEYLELFMQVLVLSQPCLLTRNSFVDFIKDHYQVSL